MRSGSVSSVERIVVPDFDGTVAAGDDPVHAFPHGVAGDAADADMVRWAAAHGVPEARRPALPPRIEAWWSASPS